MSLLTEVDYIDGVQEFYEEDYITELLGKNTNRFSINSIPVEGTIRFSGDTLLFKKQVYKKDDLSIEGAWMIDGKSIVIQVGKSLSEYTYTYITYKRKATYKKEGLFSVDYVNGILYTSTPIKNIQIDYKYAIQYVEGDKMTQVDSSEYTYNTIYSINTDDKSRLVFEYQVKNDQVIEQTEEYYTDGKVSILTLGDKDE